MSPGHISDYLILLTDKVSHRRLNEPVIHRSELDGEAGWVHWSSVEWQKSGAHFYEWENERFFSVDIYCCAEFDILAAVRVTDEIMEASELVWREV